MIVKPDSGKQSFHGTHCSRIIGTNSSSMNAGRRFLADHGQIGSQKGCLRRLHFMRPFAPCFSRYVALIDVDRLQSRGRHVKGSLK